MNVSKLQKMIANGGGDLRKAIGEINDQLARLERDVAALEVQPSMVKQSTYRVIDKTDDDIFVYRH
jgi:hypothetical protein